jgi:hypothetical protein
MRAKILNKIAPIGVAAALFLATGTASATTTPNNIPNDLRAYAGSAAAEDLLVRADEALNALTYTYYRFAGTYFDDDDGVYKVDCSGYLNRMVEDAVPDDFDRLRDVRSTDDPTAEDYYYLFRSISYGETRYGWKRIKRVADLKPGDVMVWRYQEPETPSTGHSTIVVDLPKRDSRWSNVWRVRVTDSARSGHASDNRGSSGSGVGAGWLMIKVSSDTGAPIAYSWTTYASWHSDISFALARPY